MKPTKSSPQKLIKKIMMKQGILHQVQLPIILIMIEGKRILDINISISRGNNNSKDGSQTQIHIEGIRNNKTGTILYIGKKLWKICLKLNMLKATAIEELK